jgi:hypothetical protein
MEPIRTDEAVYPPQAVLDKTYVSIEYRQHSAFDDPQLDQGQVG